MDEKLLLPDQISQATPQIFSLQGWNAELDSHQASATRRSLVQKWVEEVFQPQFLTKKNCRYESILRRLPNFHFPEVVEYSEGKLVQYRGWKNQLSINGENHYTLYIYSFDFNGNYCGLQCVTIE